MVESSPVTPLRLRGVDDGNPDPAIVDAVEPV
jgi:hypothetical protein